MSELAIRAGELVSQSSLVDWADEARAAASIAVSLAKTPFVPSSLRGSNPDVTVANITAAILTGREVGLQPMAALRSIDVIQGTPAMRALLQRALVQAAGHEVWTEKESPTEVVVCGQRHGSDKVERSTWSIGRAQQMGLTGKDNWKKQPQAMLVARATAEVCRRVAADVLVGLPYASEELDADVEPAGDAPKRRTVRRRQADESPVVEPGPEPELEPVADAEPVDEPAGWPAVRSADEPSLDVQ